jgi:ParB-like chromosome segregation protein Spo0J
MAKINLTSMADLKPASYNPREIGLAELKALANSLGHFGDLSGITWNSQTGNIVCGHQRIAALKAKFGTKLALGSGQNGDSVLNTPDGEAFRVRVVDWPLEKEKAANIAANSPTAMGHFTEELQSVLDEIMAEWWSFR